jgi:cytochrome c5
MIRKGMRAMNISVVLLLFLAVTACGNAATPKPAPTSNPDSAPSSSLAPEAHGPQLFADKGCAACHGQNAEGSDIAPALPGHTAEQVRRQVRNPIGTMPRFGPEQLSDKELEELIEFITELKSEGHEEPLNLSMDDVVTMHHWMAILSLKADGVAEARHHVNHIIDLVEPADHRRQMEEVLEALDADHLHKAEHSIEEMLAGTAEPELSLGELHLQLVLSALAVHDAADAQHHMSHFMEEAEPSKVDLAGEAMEHLNTGELHEAEELVKELIESSPHHQHRHDQ